MGKYLHHYETEDEFAPAYYGSDYHEPWVSYTDEDDFTPHVDYNKITGNKVIIDYRLGEHGNLLNDVVGVTDDFVPESEGATYVFRTPSARIEYVVGQTYSDGDGGYITFSGLWFAEVNPDIQIWPINNQDYACRINTDGTDFWVSCPRT